MESVLSKIKHGEKVLAELKVRPQYPFELAQTMSFNLDTVQTCLGRLLKKGYVRKERSGRYVPNHSE
jgi:predicted transcriptional regulator